MGERTHLNLASGQDIYTVHLHPKYCTYECLAVQYLLCLCNVSVQDIAELHRNKLAFGFTQESTIFLCNTRVHILWFKNLYIFCYSASKLLPLPCFSKKMRPKQHAFLSFQLARILKFFQSYFHSKTLLTHYISGFWVETATTNSLKITILICKKKVAIASAYTRNFNIFYIQDGTAVLAKLSNAIQLRSDKHTRKMTLRNFYRSSHRYQTHCCSFLLY